MYRAIKRATISSPQSLDEQASGSPLPCSAESSSKAAKASLDTEAQQHADASNRYTFGSSDAEVCHIKPNEALVLRIVPRNVFIFVSILFWGTVLVNSYHYSKFVSEQNKNLGSKHLDTLELLPCNPGKRVLAVCAHRGNAAELMSAGASSGSSSSGSYSLQDRMTVLWRSGITCFDLDVIQLSDGQLVVAHPAELVQLAAQSRSKGSSGAKVVITRESLHNLKLADLRAAGMDAEAVPQLITVVRHFAHLRRSKPISISSSSSSSSSNSSNDGGSSSSSSVKPHVRKVPLGQASAERSLQYVPLLSLELKGPAAASFEAWTAVIATVEAAGVADSVVLCLRHQRSSSSSSGGAGSGDARVDATKSAVMQLAQRIRKDRGSSSSGGGSGGQTPVGLGATAGPLIGLIVADNIWSPGNLLPISGSSSSSRTTEVRSMDGAAAAAATAVIHAAVGLPYRGSSSANGDNSNGSSSSAPAVLASFDMLAPSIRLPAAVLATLLTWRPSLSWAVDDAEAMQRAAWLGVDMGVSNTPVHLAAFAAQAGSNVCH